MSRVRAGNLVLADPPDEASTFDRLAQVAADLQAGGHGELAFVGERAIDARSRCYSFALGDSARLHLFDDEDLRLRYLALEGAGAARDALEHALRRRLAVLSPEQCLQHVVRSVHDRPAWLNALALASATPAPPAVRECIERCLSDGDEAVQEHAVHAAFLLGADAFAAQLRRLAATGTPFLRRLLASLGVTASP